jgi:aminopeptidase
MIEFSENQSGEMKMADIRLARLARLLVQYSTAVKPGDVCVVRGNLVAEPLMREIVREVTMAGGHSVVQMTSDGISEAFRDEASDGQLDFLPPDEVFLRTKSDVNFFLDGTYNTRTLTGVDPERQQRYGRARAEMRKTFLQRAADGKARWVIGVMPNGAMAQEADMSLGRYEDFVFNSCHCDKEDPVAEWQRIEKEQQRVVDFLKGKDVISIQSPNAELTLSVKERLFLNAAGRNNMPDGEVYTGPVEDSANGWVQYTYPAIHNGREVEGIRLDFKDGKVVKASAEKNEAYLLSQLDSDEGARYLGEFAIGTNYGIQDFTKEILFDEKIGGSFHMALGASYPETGGRNHSAIHWDMICDIRTDSEIRVDGELLYKDGQFQI